MEAWHCVPMKGPTAPSSPGGDPPLALSSTLSTSDYLAGSFRTGCLLADPCLSSRKKITGLLNPHQQLKQDKDTDGLPNKLLSAGLQCTDCL